MDLTSTSALVNSIPSLKAPLRSLYRFLNGMTTVQHADGSYQTVLGEGIASGKVYIIDGQLQGQAADLPFSEIEV